MASGKHAAMDFRRRQTAKRFRDLIFRDKPCLGNIHSNQHLRRIGTRCNGSAASLSFEFRVPDAAITDFHPQFHDVPAYGVRYFGDGIAGWSDRRNCDFAELTTPASQLL